MTAKKVFLKLLDKAMYRRCFASTPDSMHYGWLQAKGKEIPDHALPGRLINDLSDEEREALKDLKAEMTDDRVGYHYAVYPIYDTKGG